MTGSGQNDTDERIDLHRRVVLSNGVSKIVTIRRDGDDAVWLKPELDGDGEYHLTLQQLVALLDELGINFADLAIGRWK